MSKVKKRQAVGGSTRKAAKRVTHVTAAKPRQAKPLKAKPLKAKPLKAKPLKAKPLKATRKQKPKPGPRRKTTSASKAKLSVPPAFRVEALDPLRKCGAATSVQALYRLEERGDARPVFHLVFLDRHGWYCEHGRACPAVAQAKKFDRQHGSPRTRPQPVG